MFVSGLTQNSCHIGKKKMDQSKDSVRATIHKIETASQFFTLFSTPHMHLRTCLITELICTLISNTLSIKLNHVLPCVTPSPLHHINSYKTYGVLNIIQLNMSIGKHLN